jgi:hypothetical protein
MSLNRFTVHARIRRGWNVLQARTEPAKPHGNATRAVYGFIEQHPNVTRAQIVRALPHVLGYTIDRALARLRSRGDVVISGETIEAGKRVRRYAASELAATEEPLDDDGWSPGAWRHPYRRSA